MRDRASSLTLGEALPGTSLPGAAIGEPPTRRARERPRWIPAADCATLPKTALLL